MELVAPCKRSWRCALFSVMVLAAIWYFQAAIASQNLCEHLRPQNLASADGADANSVPPGRWCTRTWYESSSIEKLFYRNADVLTANRTILCETLKPWNYEDSWRRPIREGRARSPQSTMFSTLCREGFRPQVLEPLAGVLRDPRFLCDFDSPDTNIHLGTRDWLVMADSSDYPPQPGTRRLFFDAGGTTFAPVMQWFAQTYEDRGLPLDEIYVWEVKNISEADYWANVPEHITNRYKPKLTRYNAVGIVTGLGAEHNPMTQIHKKCRAQDFCVFKLDVDTPSVEMPVVHQLIENPGHVSEFFFEHHVWSPLMFKWWGTRSGVNGTFQYSYDIFTRLRQKGIRAHSWI